METNLDVVVGVYLKYILILNRVVMKAINNPLKSPSSPKCTYIYATGAITDEKHACAILTSIPRFTTMPTETIILNGPPYGPGIRHTPLIF